MRKLAALVACFALAGSLVAHDITLTWNPASGDVAGYRVYYAPVGQSLTNVWLVGVTNLTTITNLVSATNLQYRFSCVAFDGAGVESDPSLELITVITPHAVKNPRFVGRSSQSFMLTWTPSDEADAATYRITYGTVMPWTTNTVTVAHPANTVTISGGLVQGTDYYFDFTVVNGAGVESLPKYQLREKLLPGGLPDLSVDVLVH